MVHKSMGMFCNGIIRASSYVSYSRHESDGYIKDPRHHYKTYTLEHYTTSHDMTVEGHRQVFFCLGVIDFKGQRSLNTWVWSNLDCIDHWAVSKFIKMTWLRSSMPTR